MVAWRAVSVGAVAASAVAAAVVLPVEGGPSRPQAQAVAAATARPLAGKVIVIDPGHNGRNYKHPKVINRKVPAGPFKKACDTTGTATDSGYAEHAYTFDVATRMARLLRAQGATVHLTRPNDTGVGPCVNQRAALANKVRAHAAISIHADGAPGKRRGFHVILPGYVKGYTGPIVTPSKWLGYDIRYAFRKGTGQPYANYIGRDGLDVRTDLGGLNMSKVPKVFIECGNMRNATDAARMRSAAWRQRAAVSLATGMAHYLKR
ncbi:N-acetylmuramoyl-L-alanine amidase [Actinomadura hibisca]|uniref:N-acetylmuramoyl-L-alanine amidase n=1 Tax=Actinomadura hibisca TaxID=68565 RepID=UPI000835D94D|nr:N-acetylmuramoyl-L-alanine amidase [Actinomadura hibisca]